MCNGHRRRDVCLSMAQRRSISDQGNGEEGEILVCSRKFGRFETQLCDRGHDAESFSSHMEQQAASPIGTDNFLWEGASCDHPCTPHSTFRIWYCRRSPSALVRARLSTSSSGRELISLVLWLGLAIVRRIQSETANASAVATADDCCC